MKKAQYVGISHPVRIPKKGKDRTVSIYMIDPETVAADIYDEKTLAKRYVIDTDTGEHNTYICKEKKWKKEKLENYFGCCRWTCRKEAEIRKQYNLIIEKEVREKLEETTDVIYAITNREYSFDSASRRNAEDRRRQRISDLMQRIPPIPGDFQEWFFRVSGLDNLNYLIYDEENERYRCTKCGKKIPKREAVQIKNCKKTICPICGAEVTPRKNRNQLEITVKGHAVLIQEIDDHNMVIRYMDLEVLYDKNFKGIRISEAERMIYSWKIKDGMMEKSRRLYYAQYGRDQATYELEFDWKRNPYGRMAFDSFLYPTDITEICRNHFTQAKAYMLRAIAENHICVNVGRLVSCVKHDDSAKLIEYTARLGYQRLIRESFENRIYGEDICHDLYSPDHEVINHIMDLPKQERNRLRDIDGGHIAYEWLGYCSRHHKHISDKTLKFMEDNKIDPVDIIKYSYGISPERIENYLMRQQKESYPKKNPNGVREQWTDYLSMAQKLGKDLNDEMILFPRQLKMRHEQLVEEDRQRKAIEDMVKNREASMKREKELQKKYPGAAAALETIREKYEYTDESFKIIVPGHLYEIVQEGYALHHCVGSSDRYFERMERGETYICFLRRTSSAETPYYTIEIEPGGTIRQHRSFYDEEPGIEEIRSFLREWQREIKKRLNGNDMALARKSKELRELNMKELLETKGQHDRVYKGLLEDFMEAI